MIIIIHKLLNNPSRPSTPDWELNSPNFSDSNSQNIILQFVVGKILYINTFLLYHNYKYYYIYIIFIIIIYIYYVYYYKYFNCINCDSYLIDNNNNKNTSDYCMERYILRCPCPCWGWPATGEEEGWAETWTSRPVWGCTRLDGMVRVESLRGLKRIKVWY